MRTEKTAWYNECELPEDMVEGALGKKTNFKKLEESPHFSVLEEFISKTNCESMADLGCGAGEAGRVFREKFRYTGFDLPHIIEKVGKKINPNLDFIHFDANENDFSFLSDYDLVLCNGFLSELTNPLDILHKILNYSKKFVIIHRQFIDAATRLEDYITYGNLNTPRSLIGRKDLSKTISSNGFEIVETHDSSDWGHSFLLKKIKN